MTEPVVTTSPQAKISVAAQLMHERKIGCLPVLDGTKLVGILTESDLIAAIASD